MNGVADVEAREGVHRSRIGESDSLPSMAREGGLLHEERLPTQTSNDFHFILKAPFAARPAIHPSRMEEDYPAHVKSQFRFPHLLAFLERPPSLFISGLMAKIARPGLAGWQPCFGRDERVSWNYTPQARVKGQELTFFASQRRLRLAWPGLAEALDAYGAGNEPGVKQVSFATYFSLSLSVAFVLRGGKMGP